MSFFPRLLCTQVKRLCQPIFSEGPGPPFEDIYWLAVQVSFCDPRIYKLSYPTPFYQTGQSFFFQAMANTSAWQEALESALKQTKTSLDTEVMEESTISTDKDSTTLMEGSLGAFSILIQQALKVCCQYYSQ